MEEEKAKVSFDIFLTKLQMSAVERKRKIEENENIQLESHFNMFRPFFAEKKRFHNLTNHLWPFCDALHVWPNPHFPPV